MVINLTGHELETKLSDTSGVSLLNFTASWCSPCKRLAPTVEKLSVEKNNINFIKIDIDEEPRIASRYGVRSLPDLILVKDGKPVSHHAGNVSIDDIKSWLVLHGL